MQAYAREHGIVAGADHGRVDLGDLGRRARKLLDAARPPEPPKLF